MARVLLCTEEPVLARGFVSLLASVDGFKTDTVCNNPDYLPEIAAIIAPDIVLMDFFPDENLPTVMQIRRRAPGCKIILWVHRITVEMAYQLMNLGVRGVLRKTLSPEMTLQCLQQVAGGEMWFEKELTAGFLEGRQVSLTPREFELLTLVAHGMKNKDIAAELSISEPTVRVYLTALFRKLGVRDRYELALYGLKNMFGGGLRDCERARGSGQGLRLLVLKRSITGNGHPLKTRTA